MPGQESESRWSELLPVSAYRSAITAADASGPDDATIPVFGLHANTKFTQTAPGSSDPRHPSVNNAAHGRLIIFANFDPDADQATTLEDDVLADGDAKEHANVEVWLWGGNLSSITTGQWYLFAVKSVTGPTAINLVDVPMMPAKIVVPFISADCSLNLNLSRSV